jgi:hypothetical protein
MAMTSDYSYKRRRKQEETANGKATMDTVMRADVSLSHDKNKGRIKMVRTKQAYPPLFESRGMKHEFRRRRGSHRIQSADRTLRMEGDTSSAPRERGPIRQRRWRRADHSEGRPSDFFERNSGEVDKKKCGQEGQR